MSCQFCLQICPLSSPPFGSQAAIFVQPSWSLTQPPGWSSFHPSFLPQPTPASFHMDTSYLQNWKSQWVIPTHWWQDAGQYFVHDLCARPAPFPRLISSNSPQHILLQLQKNYSPNKPYSFMTTCVCLCCFLSKECPSSSSLMFSDSRL